jgi:CRP-like cAMP-binding protein
MTPVNQSPFKNLILKALDRETIARLALVPVVFEVEHEIEFPGDAICHLYFVEEGMASITTTFSNGAQVEVGMFGYESIIGVSALMGTKQSLNRVYTQIAGSGYSCSLEAGRREFKRDGVFQLLALRYVQTQLLQAMQSAGCNAQHEVDQRLARWLLICSDRAQTTTFKMSHDYLAHMLGNSRPSVSQAAAMLKGEGLIEYTRGVIHIPDVKQLEAKACECYQVIKKHLDSYAEFESGISLEATNPSRSSLR